MKNNYTQKPLVAIWMITYNHEPFIAQAIDSVMMQKTDFNYRLFIGEDYSTDGTRFICSEYKEKYSERIELVFQKENTGGYKCAQDLYKQCFQSGAKYIAMCDGDDYWTDTYKLQKQVNFLESNRDYTFVFTPSKVIYSSGYKASRIRNKFKEFNSENFKLSNILKLGGGFYPTSTVMYDSSVLDPAGLFYELHWKCNAGDWVLAIMATLSGSIGYIDELTAVYRIHGSSLSNQIYCSYEECSQSAKSKHEMNVAFLDLLFEKVEIERRLRRYLVRKEEYILLSKYLDCGLGWKVLKFLSLKNTGILFAARLIIKCCYVSIFRDSPLKVDRA